MSFETRSATYVYATFVLSGLTVVIIIAGITQQWKPEQFAGVISATVTAGSITFLVMDRLLFDRPKFQIFFDDKIVNDSGENKAPMENKLALRVRNIGFRDAYSVHANIYVLSKDFLIKKDIPGKMQDIKIGEDKRWLVPIFDIRYPEGYGSNNIEGWIRVEVLSPLSRRDYLARYIAAENTLMIFDPYGYLRGYAREFVYLSFLSLPAIIWQYRNQVKFHKRNRIPAWEPIKIKLDDREPEPDLYPVEVDMETMKRKEDFIQELQDQQQNQEED